MSKSSPGKTACQPGNRAKPHSDDPKDPSAQASGVRAQYMASSEREKNIVELATQYFAIHGFNVSTRELADYIGVTQPLLYRYFGSKEQLIERVEQEVFFSRWDPQWKEKLLDTSQPVERRLVEYLENYTTTILKNDWVRLFIFSALRNPELNLRYIKLLKSEIFIPLLSELRDQHGLHPEPSEMDIELFWGFHSSFYYVGVRRWIYRLKTPKDIHELINTRVSHFLFGYNAILENEKHSNGL